MKVAIIFSSNTGNTRALAEHIRTALSDEEIVYFGNVADNIPDADIYYIGSWTNRGSAATEIENFLKDIDNKKIAYFGTAGFGESEQYFAAIFDKAKLFVNSSNMVVGHFICQGKMPMSVRKRYEEGLRANPDDTFMKICIANFDEALNHPNEGDFCDVEKWALDMIKMV